MPEDNDADLNKIYNEIDAKIIKHENNFTTFHNEHTEGANAYRMLSRERAQGRPKTAFNSRVGETNRAGNTLADVWQRMLTALDPYIEARRMGLNNFGQRISDVELYGTEQVIMRQLQDFYFKKELRKALISLSMFGLVVVEEPWIRNKRTGLEGTGFMLRSLLQTFFDPHVFDVDMSEYIGFVDYMSEDTLRWLAKSDPETWDVGRTERGIFELKNIDKTSNHEAWSRIQNRRMRAGYLSGDGAPPEVITYHGKLDLDNKYLQGKLNETGREEDTDWTVRIVGRQVVSVTPTAYGDWRAVVKTATYNQFELEPIGYGVSRVGRKQQKELDATQSRLNDLLLMSTLNMWKAGRYAGLRQGSLPITPLGIVQVDDVKQLEPLRPPAEVLPQGINLMNMWKEDFRSTTGAKTNLQAEITGATATESGLAQVEAMRSAGVAAEIIAETLVKTHIETMHLNNLFLLDKEVWVNIAGFENPMSFNKDTLPINVGWTAKVTTDKSFRPQRAQQIIQALQVITSVKQDMPEALNAVRPLVFELYRSMDMDPRMLAQPVPVQDQLMRRARKLQQLGSLTPEMEGELAGEASPQNVNVDELQTPVGVVPTSPVAPVEMI